MAEDNMQGTCDPRLKSVQTALEDNISSGEELGASMVVNVDGETIMDVWGGFRDPARTSPWTEHTITNVWSTTKTVTNLAALMLVERGTLDVYKPVATYWPEFAANGKEDIEVRHLLSHTSGVSGWEQPVTVEDIYDRERSTAKLADQAPWWKPGSASGYHALDQGHLVGEVVRRVSGRTLTEFVATEITGPLGADFQIGAKEADWDRIADVVAPPPMPIDMSTLDPQSPMYKTFTGPAFGAETANTAGWRQAEIGAANGHGNARSIARILSAIALGGEVDGVRLLSPTTIDLIFDEQAHGPDLVLGIPLRWGIGYGLPELETLPYIPDGRICFWGGYGGSMIVMDLDRRMTISYMMNNMGAGIIGSVRSAAYLAAVYDAIG
jgi:CubicO group peptidase (beta-lactamase class C family)